MYFILFYTTFCIVFYNDVLYWFLFFFKQNIVFHLIAMYLIVFQRFVSHTTKFKDIQSIDSMLAWCWDTPRELQIERSSALLKL